MTYLPGTEILVTGFQEQAGPAGPQPLNVSQARPRRAKENPYFEAGVLYTLYNVRQQKDGSAVYSFARQDTKQVIEQWFKSVGAAEAAIAEARGESLPDYDGYHQRYS